MPVVIDTFEALPAEPQSAPRASSAAADRNAPAGDLPQAVVERIAEIMADRARRVAAH